MTHAETQVRIRTALSSLAILLAEVVFLVLYHLPLTLQVSSVLLLMANLTALPLIYKGHERGRNLMSGTSIGYATVNLLGAIFVSYYLLIPMILSIVILVVLDRYSVKEVFFLPIKQYSVKWGTWRSRAAAVLTHIFLLTLVIVTTFPVVWVISVSITPGSTLTNTELKIWPDQPTLEHYSYVLFDKNLNFWHYFMNSVIVSLGTTILGIFLASTAAYALSRYEFFGKGAVLKSFLLVQMFPGVIIIVPYFIILKTYGLLNSYIGLILAYSVTALPLCLYMIKGFFDTIPRDLEEAAMVDGATPMRIFFTIILPLALPAIAVTALFSFLAAWNEYLLAYTFMQDSSYYTLPVKIYALVSGTQPDWGTFAAMSIIVSVPVVILFIITQKYLISGMTTGGVKG